MNLILFEKDELNSEGRGAISGRRGRHLLEVLKVTVGDRFKAGFIDGDMGEAKVLEISDGTISVEFTASGQRTPSSELTVILALPRPKVLRRVLKSLTVLGAKEIYLINSFRVEKPYWSSQQVTADYIKRSCLLGLELSVDTILPKVYLRQRFRPFVEDELPALVAKGTVLVGHPGDFERANFFRSENLQAVIIGPEGGFIPYEIELLNKVGVKTFSLGPRILDVETAVTFTLGAFLNCWVEHP